MNWSATEKRTVPRRLPNAEYRTREYLTEKEVERLIEAAKANRHGHRDATMLLIGFRHGLRAGRAAHERAGGGARESVPGLRESGTRESASGGLR
jgi:integrase